MVTKKCLSYVLGLRKYRSSNERGALAAKNLERSGLDLENERPVLILS